MVPECVAAAQPVRLQRWWLSHAQLYSHIGHHAAWISRRTLVPGRSAEDSAAKVRLAGVALCAIGLLLHFTGICPIVKRIWTPSWTLFSGGVCFFFLAAFSWIVDVKKHHRFAFPFVVIGMNSIAAYVIAELCRNFVESSFRIHLGESVLNVLGPGLEPTLVGALTLCAYWLVLYWMFKKRIFVRI